MTPQERWAYEQTPQFKASQDAFLRVCMLASNIVRAARISRLPLLRSMVVDRPLYDGARAYCRYVRDSDPPLRFSGIEMRPWDGLDAPS